MDKQSYIDKLKKMHYRIVGKHQHSAVSVCHWTKEDLVRDRCCYKSSFYGIDSSRCLQMTPCIYCQQKCVFCWRYQPASAEWLPKKMKWDDPEEIVEGSVDAQRKLLTGYGGNEKCDKKKLAEAQHPNQAAISLAGEPTLYPKIGGLIEEFHKRKYTTFLVTNGLLPERLAEITLPTQLYLSLDAPNEEVHKKINVPMVPDSWERINKTLELFPSLDTRKVIRITLVKGWNDFAPEEYAKLIAKSNADFVEVKAYMFIGASRQRMSIDNMPRHHEVKAFAEKVGEELGYSLAGEQEASRVVLFSSGEKSGMI
ncbi:MAG: 4-demethylwyosine synthase TYW1 [Candidatus Diapherotrites archaeon]|nr:4-demethylwyosine synthase TYW1 [Candidatus Diapherotrites archaeon]